MFFVEINYCLNYHYFTDVGLETRDEFPAIFLRQYGNRIQNYEGI